MHHVSGMPVTTGHDVLFYESDEALASVVGRFLAEGVRAGQPILVIATPAHRKQIVAKMRALGADPDELVSGRDILMLDARDTLAAFMEGDVPNAEVFDATVGNVLEKLTARRRDVVVRAYGEMVDLLWRDGNAEAANSLEEMWNEAAHRFSFLLVCGYDDEVVRELGGKFGIPHVCATHRSVLQFDDQSES
jgi:KaiC/GvpD/RAD55 family RecA-like ATPase